MQRKELSDHIKGSYLKRQHLEAFLVQSAYIEGLLKILADYSFWEEVSDKLLEGNKIMTELRIKIRKLGLNELINFLHKASLINDNQKKVLHKYREKRNQVLHDLVLEISEEKFDKELREVCKLGDQIINDDEFQRIEKILDEVEQRREQRKNNNNNKRKGEGS